MSTDFDLDAMLMDQLLRHERGLPEISPEAYLAGPQIRMTQVIRLWDLGVGRVAGNPDFEEYVATIPHIPTELLDDDKAFPFLVLVEPRIGFMRLCNLGGIQFDGDDKTCVAYDRHHVEFKQPTWIRIQDGRKNQGRSVKECRKDFTKHELGLTALQGVCAYLQHPTVVTGAHAMDLPGFVRREVRDRIACLWVGKDGTELGWDQDGRTAPEFGSASRRKH